EDRAKGEAKRKRQHPEHVGEPPPGRSGGAPRHYGYFRAAASTSSGARSWSAGPRGAVGGKYSTEWFVIRSSRLRTTGTFPAVRLVLVNPTRTQKPMNSARMKAVLDRMPLRISQPTYRISMRYASFFGSPARFPTGTS